MQPASLCPSCGNVHQHVPAGDAWGCPLTGRRVSAAALAAARLPRDGSGRDLFRQTPDAWLALTASYVLDERDREHYAAAWSRLARHAGPYGASFPWTPSGEELRDAVLTEIARRRARRIEVAPASAEAYGAGAPFLAHLRSRPVGEAAFVRARRCTRCGAPKQTRARTAFIYCDYCAAYFDYDLEIASQAAGSVDPRYAWQSLMTGYREELRAAREANDPGRLARLWREFYTYCTLMCPAACSPRQRDPAWRRAVVDGYLVPIAVAKSFDAAWGEAVRDVERAEDAIERDAAGRVRWPGLLAVLRLWERALALEAALAERGGLFAAHPDGLERELFLRVNRAELARKWLGQVDAEGGRALVEELQLQRELIELPAATGGVHQCGVCGSAVPILAGAREVLCETCGWVLDARAVSVRCPSCAAPVALAVGARAGRCSHCDLVVEPL